MIQEVVVSDKALTLMIILNLNSAKGPKTQNQLMSFKQQFRRQSIGSRTV